jgi:hypothetical protein
VEQQTNPSTPTKMATKQFIGSGKAHSQFDSVTVTLKLEDAQKYAYEREHGTFLTFVVSKRKPPDNFGRTHSAFVLLQDDEQQLQLAIAPTEAPAKKPRKAKKSNLSPTA